MEYPKGLACRDRCEADVEAVIDLIDTNVKAAGLGTQLVLGYRRAMFASAAFIVLMGGVFVAAGVRSGGPGGFLFLFGSLCVLFGLYHFYRALKLKSTAPGSESTPSP